MKQAAAALKEESAAPSTSKAADDGDPPELVRVMHMPPGKVLAWLLVCTDAESLCRNAPCRWSPQLAATPCSSSWTWDSPGTGKSPGPSPDG
jgi:hypothetical protein